MFYPGDAVRSRESIRGNPLYQTGPTTMKARFGGANPADGLAEVGNYGREFFPRSCRRELRQLSLGDLRIAFSCRDRELYRSPGDWDSETHPAGGIALERN